MDKVSKICFVMIRQLFAVVILLAVCLIIVKASIHRVFVASYSGALISIGTS